MTSHASQGHVRLNRGLDVPLLLSKPRGLTIGLLEYSAFQIVIQLGPMSLDMPHPVRNAIGPLLEDPFPVTRSAVRRRPAFCCTKCRG